MHWNGRLAAIAVVACAGSALAQEPGIDGGQEPAADPVTASTVAIAPAAGPDIASFDLEELLNSTIEVSSKSATTLDQAPGIVAVIDRADIERSGAKTLGDIIRMVPGFDSSRAAPGSGDPFDAFFARGITSDFSQNVLLLLNGRNKLNDLTFNSPAVAHRVNVEMIERLEVIRGPASALYGAGAFAGVINIVTRDSAGADGTSAKALFGENTQLRLHALHKQKIAGFTVGAQGIFFYDGGRQYDALRYDKSYPARIGGGFELPQHTRVTDGVRPSFDVSLTASAPDDRVRVQVWHTQHNPHAFLSGLYPNPTLNRYGQRAVQTLANVDVKLIEGLSLGAHYSSMYRQTRSVLSPALGAPATNVRLDPALSLGDEDIFGTVLRNDHLQVDLSYQKTLGSHSLLFGLTGSREAQWGSEATYWGSHWDPSLPSEEVTSTLPEEGLIAYRPHTRYYAAIFAQDIWQLFESLSLTAALRYERFNDVPDPLILVERLALVWTPIKGHTFKALYGKAYRAPSGFETFGIFGGSAISSPDILPERIYTGELSYITYFTPARLEVSAYLSEVRNSILAVEDNDPTRPNKLVNAGQVKAWGVEVELQGKQWWLNYSYVDSRSASSKERLDEHPTPLIAAHMLNAGVELDLLEDRLSWGAQLYLRSPRREQLGGLSDLQAWVDTRLKLSFKPVSVILGVTNLLNQEFAFPLNDGGRYPVPYRGREVYGAISLDLE